jgi:hypothetical protein
MGWLKSILSFFTGSSGAKAAEILDEAVFTQQEKATEDKQFTADILANTSIDLFNRLVRPGVTVYYIGGFADWWKLPDTTKVDPVHFQIFLIIITFWFGGRVLLKDLPNTVFAILAMRDKFKKG